MGADFLLAYVPIPDDFNEVRQRINELSDDKCLALQMSAMYGYERDGAYVASDVVAEDIRDYLREAVDILEDLSNEGIYRSCVVLNIGGHLYAFTGGMSWGDDPTNMFTPFTALDESGVIDDPTVLP